MSWSKVKIGSFLKRRKDSIEVQNSILYRRITIKTKHQGIYLRDEQKGSLIGTKLQFFVHKGQFLLSKIDARLGAFGIVPDDLDHAIITGNFWAFDVDKEQVNIEWFNLFTSSGNFYEICNRASSGTTHRKYLDETKFLNFEIYLPDIDDQNDFIQSFNGYKKKHSELENELGKQQTYLQQLRQSILQEAVQGKLTQRHPDDEPASKLLERIKAEKEVLIQNKTFQRPKEHSVIEKEEYPYELPMNWTIAKLVDLCFVTKLAGFEFTKYIKLKENGEVPVVRAQNVRKNYIDETSLKYIDLETSLLLNRCALNSPSLLITFIGAGIGDVAVFDKTERWHLAPNVAKAVPFNHIEEKIDIYYLCYYLLSSIGQSELFKFNKATAQPNLSMSTIRQAIIALPPLAEQKRIVTKVQQLMQMVNQLELQVQQSQTQVQQLLQAVLKEAFSPKVEKYTTNEMVSVAAEN